MSSIGWFARAMLSAVFAALTAIFAKIGVRHIDPDFATFLRTAVVLLALAALTSSMGKWSNPATLPRQTLIYLCLSGLATGASWMCYFRALQLGHASNVAAIDKLSVVLVALLASAFLQERPSSREWFGIGLITAGALVLAIRK